MDAEEKYGMGNGRGDKWMYGKSKRKIYQLHKKKFHNFQQLLLPADKGRYTQS